jgi:hypothetical protein
LAGGGTKGHLYRWQTGSPGSALRNRTEPNKVISSLTFYGNPLLSFLEERGRGRGRRREMERERGRERERERGERGRESRCHRQDATTKTKTRRRRRKDEDAKTQRRKDAGTIDVD